MPIDKDLKNVYNAMVKTTYRPIILRTIVLLLIQYLDRMQAAMQLNDLDFFNVIRTEPGKKALCVCLDTIQKRSGDIIQEILLQYGIHTSGEMVDFYHESMHTNFIGCINRVKLMIWNGRYDMLDKIARTQQ